jgi:hypothetical protein
MSTLGIFELTGIASTLLFLAPDSMKRLFDYLVPIYTILAVLCIIAFKRFEKSDSANKKDRIYNVPRKAKPGNVIMSLLSQLLTSNTCAGVELTWKQKFAGTWDKYERKGWIEVCNLSFANHKFTHC